MAKQTESLLVDSELIELERLAVELATWAGAEASQALNSEPEINYKPRGPHRRPRADGDPGDPVSVIDTNIEAEVRKRVSERFPTHTLLGEEEQQLPNPDADWVWVIDPIDGTSGLDRSSSSRNSCGWCYLVFNNTPYGERCLSCSVRERTPSQRTNFVRSAFAG